MQHLGMLLSLGTKLFVSLQAPDGESQPSTEVDLFISTEKIIGDKTPKNFYFMQVWTSLDLVNHLSEAVPLSQPRGEQTKILKFEFAPLASSTMHANTLRPRILVLTSFIWS